MHECRVHAPSLSLPRKRRAIACGQFSANGRNIGIEIGSCAQLWNPAALSHARFESKISTCDCPAHKGGGSTPRLPVGPIPFKANSLQRERAREFFRLLPPKR